MHKGRLIYWFCPEKHPWDVSPRLLPPSSGFSLGHLHTGGFVLPPYSAGGQSVNGGTQEGDIDLMEGDLTSIDYIINYKYCIVKLQLHDGIYRLRFYSNSLICILSLSNSHNNAASIQKNQGDKSHCVILVLLILL